MSVRIGNSIVAGMPEKALHGIGEIFTTTDTGVIAGAVEANGGSYNLADYNSGADSIASKLAAGTLSYVSKTEFQTRVANTGACDSFGWNGAGGTFYCWHISEPDGTGYTTSENPGVGDTVYYVSKNYTTTVAGYVTEVGSNETGSYIMWTDSATVHYRTPSKDKTKASDPTFLVPKLNPWHVGKSAPVVGNGQGLGLTADNTTIRYPVNFTANNDDGSFSSTTGSTAIGSTIAGQNTGNHSQILGITTDPTKSGIIADLSETANLRVMVQLATGATDQALETCTSVLADVAGLKTDTAGMIDYVIEKQDPTSANGYMWYRKYKSGWVEQGGKFSGNSPLLVTLPITMANTAYSCFAGHGRRDGINWTGNPVTLVPETTTSLGVYVYGDYKNMTGWWEVKGMSAQ